MLASRIYDWYMLVMIIASIVPLMFIEDYPIFKVIEIITVTAFIIDYILRWYTSDIYIGPMGCRTGCYMLTRNLPHEDAIKLVQNSMRFMADFEGAIPGAGFQRE